MSAATTPLLNPSPKQRFQQQGSFVSTHREMVDSAAYNRATEFGLQQYAIMLGQSVGDGNSAMAVGFKLQGAVEILLTMRNLSETPTAPKNIPNPNLDHKS